MRGALLGTLLLLAAGGVGAQAAPAVERAGASDVALDRRLAKLLDAEPLIITADTLITRGDTVPRSVLVLDATIVVEGVILGDLVLVDAGAFVRPRSRVQGDLVNIAGGLYRSELASIGGTIIDLPTAEYRVIREPDGRFVIEAWGTPSNLKLDGVAGFGPPSYDRVAGLTVEWGATYRLPRFEEITPALHARVGWQTELGEPTYAAELSFRRFATELAGGYEHGTVTNEQWIRNDLRNSLNYIWDADDYRDYNQVDRIYGAVRHRFGDEAKSFFALAELRGQIEDARSLPADDPWSLWGDTTRVNPPIDDGEIRSGIASLGMEWEGITTALEADLSFEYAWAFDPLSAATAGSAPSAPFSLAVVTAEWAMQALANHTLEIELHGQMPLTSDTLPRQRWSFVGGSGTLQTSDFAEFYGDRVLFVETKYIIPLPERLALPIIGAPQLRFVHAAGMGWLAGDDRALHQEIGLRIQFFGLYFRYMMEPTDPSNGDLNIGLSWPFGSRHAWER